MESAIFDDVINEQTPPRERHQCQALSTQCYYESGDERWGEGDRSKSL